MGPTAAQLLAAAPQALAHILAAIADGWDACAANYQITNRNRALGFLSTCYEESGGFTVLSENLNYSAARAAEVFPSFFANAAAAEPYAYQPEKFANKVYDGRMGNALGSDDGWRFRGQGLPQITGRSEYAALAAQTTLPLLTSPAMVASDEYMLECAMACFRGYEYGKILEFCDAGNFNDVWALVGSGRANGPVINLGNHQAALAAIDKALPAN